MYMILVNIIARELGLAPDKVKNTVELLEGGATVPFISRYRKEATGSMDEVAVGNIKDMHEKLKAIVQRKDTIIATIEEQGKLTDEQLTAIKKYVINAVESREASLDKPETLAIEYATPTTVAHVSVGLSLLPTSSCCSRMPIYAAAPKDLSRPMFRRPMTP